MIKTIIFIAFGGGFGCVCRFLLQRLFSDFHFLSISWGVFLANFIGSLLIGLFYALSEKLGFSSDLKMLLTTGFCGGFTTFSTFSYENMSLLKQGDYFSFSLYVILSIIFCLFGVFVGNWLGRC